MDLGLKDKRVILTGGTRGIGRAAIDVFGEEGAKVIFCARNGADIKRVNAEMAHRGCDVTGYQADVSDRDGYTAFLQQAMSDLGGVDVFIANTSAAAQPGEEGFKAALEVDMMGAVRGADMVMPHMARQKSGALVFVGSIMAFEAMGSPGPYASIKAALLSYAGQLVEAVGLYGIRVNCVSPGPIHIEDGFWGQLQKTQPEIYSQFTERHPQKRLGQAKEVADSIVFLSSDRAKWISGSNVIVDGGFTKSIQF